MSTKKRESIVAFLSTLLLSLFVGNGIVDGTNSEPRFDFYPSKEIYVVEGRTVEVAFHLRWNQTEFLEARIFVRVEPSLRARVVGNDTFDVTSEDLNRGIDGTVIVKGIFLGHAKLAFYCEADEKNETSKSITTRTTDVPHSTKRTTELTTVTPSHAKTTANDIVADTTKSADGSSRDFTDDVDSFWDLENATLVDAIEQTTDSSIDSKTDIEAKHRRDKRRIGKTPGDRTVRASTETKSFPTISSSYVRESIIHPTDFEVLETSARHTERGRTLSSDTYEVHVIRDKGILDTAFMIFVGIFVIINLIMMGCQVELPIVWSVLRKPVGPIVGFVCQFGFMPLASYTLSQLLLTESNLQLGLFTLGCSPGGNGSNFYTLLLHGDINLSVTMTFISTLCAMFMMPMWMFTLGQKIITKGKITIPFWNLLTSLVTFCIPMAIGVGIQHFRPEWAKTTKKIIRPFTIVLIIVFNVMGYFTSSYIFSLMTWQIFLAGICVSWGGYAFGAALAWICRMTRPQIIAVSIETAIQNAGIAFMVLGLTLSQPDADLSSVAPVAQLMVTGLPLFCGYGIVTLYRKCRNWRSGKSKDKTRRLKHDSDVDTIEPLVIDRTSTVPAKDDARSGFQVGNGNPKMNQISTSNDILACANMYNDDDRVYSKPRVELKLSYDPQAKYDVPKKMAMSTFEDERKEDERPNHRDADIES